MRGHDRITVLCCRGGGTFDADKPTTYDDPAIASLGPDVGAMLAACRGLPIHLVGPRPKKPIDALLAGRVLVIGDDSDLNAVAVRLLRKDLFGAVEVAYAPIARSPVGERYGLGSGPDAAASLAGPGTPARPIPLVRNDSGGVLIGVAEIGPITAPCYVDADRIPGGTPARVRVEPEETQGLTVTVTRRRALGMGHRTETHVGRAVEFGIVPGAGTTIMFDGIRHPREVKQWVFYRHTSSLNLVRPAGR